MGRSNFFAEHSESDAQSDPCYQKCFHIDVISRAGHLNTSKWKGQGEVDMGLLISIVYHNRVLYLFAHICCWVWCNIWQIRSLSQKGQQLNFGNSNLNQWCHLSQLLIHLFTQHLMKCAAGAANRFFQTITLLSGSILKLWSWLLHPIKSYSMHELWLPHCYGLTALLAPHMWKESHLK